MVKNFVCAVFFFFSKEGNVSFSPLPLYPETMSFFLLTADLQRINFLNSLLNCIISKIQISVSKKRPPQDLGPNSLGLSSFGGDGGSRDRVRATHRS